MFLLPSDSTFSLIELIIPLLLVIININYWYQNSIRRSQPNSRLHYSGGLGK